MACRAGRGSNGAWTISHMARPHNYLGGFRDVCQQLRDPWGWSCGFYPGSHPGEHTDGTAATFDQARADFESAWGVFLAKRTEADFQAWRDQRDWTARKYAFWDEGKRLPPNEWEPGKPCSIYLKCPCGNIFNSHRLEENLVHVPHITQERAHRSA
jgi:hypothetical protein